MNQGDSDDLRYSHFLWFFVFTYLLIAIALADGQWKLNHALAIEIKNRLILSIPLAQKINNKIAGDIDTWAIKKWGTDPNDKRLKACTSEMDTSSKQLTDADLNLIRQSKTVEQILKISGKPFCSTNESQLWLTDKNKTLVIQKSPLKVTIKSY